MDTFESIATDRQYHWSRQTSSIVYAMFRSNSILEFVPHWFQIRSDHNRLSGDLHDDWRRSSISRTIHRRWSTSEEILWWLQFESHFLHPRAVHSEWFHLRSVSEYEFDSIDENVNQLFPSKRKPFGVTDRGGGQFPSAIGDVGEELHIHSPFWQRKVITPFQSVVSSSCRTSSVESSCLDLPCRSSLSEQSNEAIESRRCHQYLHDRSAIEFKRSKAFEQSTEKNLLLNCSTTSEQSNGSGMFNDGMQKSAQHVSRRFSVLFNFKSTSLIRIPSMLSILISVNRFKFSPVRISRNSSYRHFQRMFSMFPQCLIWSPSILWTDQSLFDRRDCVLYRTTISNSKPSILTHLRWAVRCPWEYSSVRTNIFLGWSSIPLNNQWKSSRRSFSIRSKPTIQICCWMIKCTSCHRRLNTISTRRRILTSNDTRDESFWRMFKNERSISRWPWPILGNLIDCKRGNSWSSTSNPMTLSPFTWRYSVPLSCFSSFSWASLSCSFSAVAAVVHRQRVKSHWNLSKPAGRTFLRPRRILDWLITNT